jgi:SAM-dependent methyltransferase
MTAGRNRDAELHNRKHWDELADVHIRSYDLGPLLGGGHVLDPDQVEEVGDVRGKTLLHMQCHIGSDTLSWARLGARVTGVDISPVSLARARELASRCGLEARFIESSLYDMTRHLDGDFDVVYTSEGVLCWLSDLREWARLIARYLKPGGFFYIQESHPFANVLDEGAEGLSIRNSYWGSPDPTEWPGDYPDYSDSGYMVRTGTMEWTWTIGDVVNSLIDAGLRIEFLHEFDRLAWKAIPAMEKIDGWYRLPDSYPRLPWMFTLKARRPQG